MILASVPHPPPVAATLATQQKVVASHDMAEWRHCCIPVPRSARRWPTRLYSTASVVNLILSTAIGVFEDFEHHRELATDGGLTGSW